VAKFDKGFDCTSCGANHEFGPYVAAHWNEALTHTCACGAQHVVQSGRVTPVKKPRTKRKPKGSAG
jgi:transcription elongation factor Elf1